MSLPFQVICELIDQPHHGIMALMDEACLNVGNTTDQMLLEHMDKKLKTNRHYASRSSDATTKKKNLELHQVLLGAEINIVMNQKPLPRCCSPCKNATSLSYCCVM